MAQLCGGGDGKVSCETLAPPPAAEDPDLPAESYLVEAGDEIGWVEANAVYERDDSTKGSTNPKSQQQQQQQQPAQKLMRPGSNRFSGSLAPKAPIIGLPNKIQHSGYLGHSSRRPTRGRIFPKKSPPGGRKAPPPAEPGSPKVSCFGKVMSERERDLCRRRCVVSTAAEEERGGCWASLAAFFRCGGGGERAAGEEEEEFGEVYSVTTEGRLSAAAAAAPGIGGMRRFSSGRRAASWGGEMDGGHVARSEALDREDVWGRRSVGSVEEAGRERIW